MRAWKTRSGFNPEGQTPMNIFTFFKKRDGESVAAVQTNDGDERAPMLEEYRLILRGGGDFDDAVELMKSLGYGRDFEWMPTPEDRLAALSKKFEIDVDLWKQWADLGKLVARLRTKLLQLIAAGGPDEDVKNTRFKLNNVITGTHGMQRLKKNYPDLFSDLSVPTKVDPPTGGEKIIVTSNAKCHIARGAPHPYAKAAKLTDAEGSRPAKPWELPGFLPEVEGGGPGVRNIVATPPRPPGVY